MDSDGLWDEFTEIAVTAETSFPLSRITLTVKSSETAINGVDPTLDRIDLSRFKCGSSPGAESRAGDCPAKRTLDAAEGANAQIGLWAL